MLYEKVYILSSDRPVCKLQKHCIEEYKGFYLLTDLLWEKLTTDDFSELWNQTEDCKAKPLCSSLKNSNSKNITSIDIWGV